MVRTGSFLNLHPSSRETVLIGVKSQSSTSASICDHAFEPLCPRDSFLFPDVELV